VTHQPIARVTRSGLTESLHHGSAVALGPDARVICAVGSPEVGIFPRSAIKPLQAVGMLRHGLAVQDQLLALVSASHGGEAYHRDGVRRLLAENELDVAQLQNTPDLPLDAEERLAWQRAGRAPSPLAQNCSGKHAGMLVTCQANGWDAEEYLTAGHPLHRALAATMAELAGEVPTGTGMDGCGAPAPVLSLTGLARGFAQIATARDGSAEQRVAGAIRHHPEWLGGTGREVTRLLRAVPGLIAKEGAEGVFAAALPDGRALAVKIADGTDRAVPVVVAGLLRLLGVHSDALDAFADRPVFGHGHPVGAIESLIGS
jgi:L-asparaginase II